MFVVSFQYGHIYDQFKIKHKASVPTCEYFVSFQDNRNTFIPISNKS